jgi:hypothetical protein
MGTFFQTLTKMQNSMSNLSSMAHERGFHKVSDDLADFRGRIESLNNDMQEYFHDNERVLRELTGE